MALLLLLQAFGQFSWAQTAGPAAQSQGYFRLISWEGTFNDLYYIRDKKKVPVTFSPFAKSEHYPLPGGEQINFFRDVAGSDGKMVAMQAGNVQVNPGWKYPLVVVSPGGRSGELTFFAYDEDPANFQAGKILLINNAKNAVTVSLSGQQVTVGSGQLQTVDLQPKALVLVDVSVSAEDMGARKTVYQRGWELEPNMRITAFIVQDADGRYRVRRLREDSSTFLPRQPKAAPKSPAVAQ